VGEILIKKLKNLKFDIIGLDWKPNKYTTIVHDISKPFDVDEKIDTIIHLAARLEHDRCSKQEYFSTNVKGTENVLNVAKNHNSYFIYISATAIYGSPQSPITEQTQISPDGYYALTKWKGEQICEKYRKHGINIAIVRPTVILGEKRLGIYKIIFKNLIKNKTVQILGNGHNKISFINVNDLVDFIIYLNEKKIPQITVNFGGIVPGTLNQMIEELKEYISSKSKIVHVPIQFIGFLKLLSKIKIIPVTHWQLSVMHKDYFFDNKLLYLTGFKYKYQPMDALKNMIDYYKNNNLG
jgi:nucleoside-diphosphate-sugar epimerase